MAENVPELAGDYAAVHFPEGFLRVNASLRFEGIRCKTYVIYLLGSLHICSRGLHPGLHFIYFFCRKFSVIITDEQAFHLNIFHTFLSHYTYKTAAEDNLLNVFYNFFKISSTFT